MFDRSYVHAAFRPGTALSEEEEDQIPEEQEPQPVKQAKQLT